VRVLGIDLQPVVTWFAVRQYPEPLKVDTYTVGASDQIGLAHGPRPWAFTAQNACLEEGSRRGVRMRYLEVQPTCFWMLISTDRRWRESVIDVVCAPAGLDLKDPRGLLRQ